MKRRFAVAGILAAAVLAFFSNADACGDKSLSAGGIRMQRALAARYPASILMYVPSASRLSEASRKLKLQETLRRVGHKYREVTTRPELEASVDTGEFNILLVDFADRAELQRHFASIGSRIVIIPVAYKLTKTESDDAARQRGLVIKAPSREVQYLTTIAEAVRSTSSTPRKG
jgi:hypothetical protein